MSNTKRATPEEVSIPIPSEWSSIKWEQHQQRQNASKQTPSKQPLSSSSSGECGTAPAVKKNTSDKGHGAHKNSSSKGPPCAAQSSGQLQQYKHGSPQQAVNNKLGSKKNVPTKESKDTGNVTGANPSEPSGAQGAKKKKRDEEPTSPPGGLTPELDPTAMPPSNPVYGEDINHIGKMEVCNSILTSIGKAVRGVTLRRGSGTKLEEAGESGCSEKPDGSDSDHCDLDIDKIISRLPFKDLTEELFSNTYSAAPSVPVVTKVYEESYMREPMHEGERPCVMGSGCECNLICREEGFVGTEMILPNERHPKTSRQMCVLCLRKATQSLYYDLVYSGILCNGVIQRYGVICGQPGEYAKEVCLTCPPNGPVQCMPYPIVSHQRNKYRVITKNGVKYMLQLNMGQQDF